MLLAFVEVTKVRHVKIPISFVELVQERSNSIRSAVTAYIAVRATVLLNADDGHSDSVEIWQAVEFSVLMHDPAKLVRVQYWQCFESTVGNWAKL